MVFDPLRGFRGAGYETLGDTTGTEETKAYLDRWDVFQRRMIEQYIAEVQRRNIHTAEGFSATIVIGMLAGAGFGKLWDVSGGAESGVLGGLGEFLARWFAGNGDTLGKVYHGLRHFRNNAEKQVYWGDVMGSIKGSLIA